MTTEHLTKTCTKCTRTLSVTDFQFKYKSKGIRRNSCADCQNAYAKKHYAANKDYYLERNNKKRKDNRQTVKEFKEANPCADCGKKFKFFVMEFDHVDPSNKKFSIGRAAWGNMKLVNKEISKCELVCANCHKARTWKRKFEENC